MGAVVKRSDISDEAIIAAIRQCKRSFTMFPTELLADQYPRKVIEAKMQQLVDRGILDYGVSLRSAWVVADQR